MQYKSNMNEIYDQMGQQDAEECEEFGGGGGGGGFFGAVKSKLAMPNKKKKANDALSSNLYNMQKKGAKMMKK